MRTQAFVTSSHEAGVANIEWRVKLNFPEVQPKESFATLYVKAGIDSLIFLNFTTEKKLLDGGMFGVAGWGPHEIDRRHVSAQCPRPTASQPLCSFPCSFRGVSVSASG
jgi:hypothetical protein